MAGRLRRAPRLRAAAADSTSRSRTRRTSCRWSPARSESLRRTPSTTSSRASSTASAAVRRGVSSSRRRSRRTASTASAHAPAKVRRYPGLKEEYYLHGFMPDADRPRPARTRSHDARSSSCERLPTSRCTTARRTRCSATFSSGSGATQRSTPSCFHGRPISARRSSRASLPSILVPEQAIDAQSLVALSDLVVSAGGTMNREAAALGVPAYTTFAGRLGAVDDDARGGGPPARAHRQPTSSSRKRSDARPSRRRAIRRSCSTSCSPPSSADPVTSSPPGWGGLEVDETWLPTR